MNWVWTPKSALKDELTEKRPLPVGLAEFHEWSERIISGAMLTSTAESQKFALANLLLSLSPTIAFEADVYFIQCLRKTAVNQVAEFIREQTRNAAKARLLAEELKQKQAEATAPPSSSAEVLENRAVCGAQ